MVFLASVFLHLKIKPTWDVAIVDLALVGQTKHPVVVATKDIAPVAPVINSIPLIG
jgi:hypothetical protein